MADSHPKKRRKRFDLKKIFDVGDKVEVRSYEEGFIGSWHPGKVTACNGGCRDVKYDNHFYDNGKKITESIEVNNEFEGIVDESETKEECRIRPRPPTMKLVKDNLHHGLCVDSYLLNAWWEGVVFDYNDGSDCREIFFPDLGDLEKVNLKNIRITRDWNEVTGEWKPRGKWLFLEIIEKYELDNWIPVSTRQIWYDMRLREKFDELGEWYSPENIPLWEQVIVKVIDEYLMLSAEQFLMAFDFLEPKSIPEANPTSLVDGVPSIDNGLKDDDLMAENETQMEMDGKLTEIDSSVEPMALSIVPSSTNSNLVLKIKMSGNSKGSRKPREKISKFDWGPFLGFRDLEPEFCPESLDEYCKSEKPVPDLLKKFRQHVLYLGWRMESKMNGRQLKIRYISPLGKVCYYPREVVQFLASERDKSSDMAENSRRVMVTSPTSSSSWEEKSSMKRKRKRKRKEEECYDLSVSPKYVSPKYVSPKYCPKAVFKYLESFNNYCVTNVRSELADNVRMHLSALGWKIWVQMKMGRADEWRYESPTSNVTYHSLKTACEAIQRGDENNIGDQQTLSTKNYALRKRGALNIRKQKRKRKSHLRSLSLKFKHEREDPKLADGKNNDKLLLISSFVSKKKKTLNKIKSCPEGHNLTRVLRSRKRVRQTGPSSSSQFPRTVLTWLIENNAVLPRSKVFYYNEYSQVPLAEGRITSDKIRCTCCQKLFTLSGFQAHAAGNNSHRPAENIFFEDGTSLVSCQVKLMRQKIESFTTEPVERVKGSRSKSWNDHICSICHYGGDLILCDQCPSSFHSICLNITDIPEGDWFCPSCCCGVCGKSQFDLNTEQFTDDSVLCCHQCERQYHARCKKERDINPGENWFCCRTCEKMHWGLQQLLDKPILVGPDNLTWTLVKPMQYQAEDHEDCDLVAMAENYSKLSVALEVMHECFEPVKEPRTKRDLVEDVLFCRESNLNRLNFKGFYTVLLERNDELITVAILRVYGDKVAEIPLIGTRFQHRRLGMCRVVMNEIEKNIMNLGVKKLVLPAAASVLNTWITSFGFSRITELDRPEFLGYTFLDFQDTVMCQKLLRKLPPLPRLSRDMSVLHRQPRRTIEGSNSIVDHEGNSSMSEVFQEEQREGSESVDQGAQINGLEDKPNGTNNNPDAPSATVTAIVSSNKESEQPSNSSEFVVRKKVERDKSDGFLQCYKRKKAMEPRPSAPQTGYSKVEVGC